MYTYTFLKADEHFVSANVSPQFASDLMVYLAVLLLQAVIKIL